MLLSFADQSNWLYNTNLSCVGRRPAWASWLWAKMSRPGEARKSPLVCVRSRVDCWASALCQRSGTWPYLQSCSLAALWGDRMSPLDLQCSRTPCKPRLRLLLAALPAPTSICSPDSTAIAPPAPLPSPPGRSSSLLSCCSPQLSWPPLLCSPQDLALITVPQLDGSLPVASGSITTNQCPSSVSSCPEQVFKNTSDSHFLVTIYLASQGSGGQQRRLAEVELNTSQTTRGRWSAVTWPGGTRDLPLFWDLWTPMVWSPKTQPFPL